MLVGSDGVLMHQLLQLGMARDSVIFQTTLSEGIAFALRHVGMIPPVDRPHPQPRM